MLVVVNKSNIQECVDEIMEHNDLGLDTETTGLTWRDRPFMVIISTTEKTYLFCLDNYEAHTSLHESFSNAEIRKYLRPLFFGKHRTFFIQNAKFDMRMLYHMGIEIKGTIHCTYAAERIIKNNHLHPDSYKLKGLAKNYFGDTEKLDNVEKYLKENKLGKKYHLVPLDVMAPYAARDAELHLNIGLKQREILHLSESMEVYKNEIRLTKTLFEMEKTGVKIDERYTKESMVNCQINIRKKRQEFADVTNREFLDSNKLFKEVFDEKGLKYPLTAKGNPSFNAQALKLVDNKISDIIKDIRFSEKMVSTYFTNLLELSVDNVIHADARQAGTETGRMSYRNPNLQNVPKQEENGSMFYVRKCFVPRQDYLFYMIDYDQQEFRVMLDYAGEKNLIKEINEGADVHQATADLLRIPRKQAKTINFATAYGVGVKELAKQLKVSAREASNIRYDYFSKLPKVKKFLERVARKAKDRGYIYNWAGRKYYLNDTRFAYKMPNHLIQGSCADILKFAMNEIGDFLEEKKSRMLVQVHDELLFEIHKDELDLIEPIKNIMENIYPSQNGAELTCSVEYSSVSWGFPDRGK